MENASKALIIAGSVIIAIILIMLGLSYFGIFGETTDSTQKELSSLEIQNYNEKFLAYEGKQNGIQARALCDIIIAHNNEQIKNGGYGIGIASNPNDIWTAIHANSGFVNNAEATKRSLKTSSTYDITFIYDSNKKGIIVAVNFEEVTE